MGTGSWSAGPRHSLLLIFTGGQLAFLRPAANIHPKVGATCSSSQHKANSHIPTPSMHHLSCSSQQLHEAGSSPTL